MMGLEAQVEFAPQLRQVAVARFILGFIVSIMQEVDARDKRGQDASTEKYPWRGTPPIDL
jgi:hypothetical protein